MPAIPDWSVAMDLTAPYGNLVFNQQMTPAGQFILVPSECKFRIGVRATKSHIPQFDGDILHYRFLTGVELDMAVELWESAGDSLPACDDLLATMLDDLTGSLRSLLNAGDNAGRLSWLVSGQAARMLDDIRLLVYPDFQNNVAQPKVTFGLDSQYPYALQLEQYATPIASGATVVLANTGNADFYPVYQVAGTTSAFTITNVTTGESLVYSGTAITSPSYAELNAFKNTVFLNGSGANLLNGVDINDSVFPKLIPGNNSVTITGADMTVLWQPAFG